MKNVMASEENNTLVNHSIISALETASKLQLNTLKEQNEQLANLLADTRQLMQEFQTDKQLIENFIGGMDAMTNRMNIQIEALITLYRRWKAEMEASHRNQ